MIVTLEADLARWFGLVPIVGRRGDVAGHLIPIFDHDNDVLPIMSVANREAVWDRDVFLEIMFIPFGADTVSAMRAFRFEL